MATYLLTGATRGIGAVVADLLRDDDLLLLGRDAATVEAACAQLPRARPLVGDLAEPESLAAAVGDQLPERLDGLVHNAGISVRGRVADCPAAEWTRQLTVNVTAVAELTRLTLPALRAAGGTVVMVNSGAGQSAATPGGVAYAASKFALRALADGLRVEEPGLRVSSVYPGRVATDMQRELRAYEGEPYVATDYLSPRSVAEAIVGVLRAPADAAVHDLSIRPRSTA